MKILIVILLVLVMWPIAIEIADVLAQTPIGQPTVSPEVQNLLTQLHTVGCNAEENAAAQTIAQLQKDNAQLKAQIQKLDPPMKASGPTKH